MDLNPQRLVRVLGIVGVVRLFRNGLEGEGETRG